MAPWKELDQMTYINKKVTRVDGAEKVTGKATFTYDVQRPGMLYGRILRSVHPHAKVLSVDTGKAEALKGVKAVLGKLKDEVTYVGDQIAAVAAVSEEIAEEALRLIKVEYEILPFTVREDEARKDGAPKVFSGRENNLGRKNENSEGDVEQGFAEADAIVEQLYHMNVQLHSPLETHGCVCEWQDDDLYMWDSTQGVHGTRSGMARALEIPENQIHVITHHMGGGFGSKFGPKDYNVVCANIAKKAGAPVKMMMNREEEMIMAGNRPSSWQKIKIGATKDGMLTAFEMESFGTGGVGGGAGVPQPYIYKFPNWKVSHVDVHINAGAGAPMRAPGHPQANFAMDSAMDELAEKLGIDPLEFRQKNDPNQTRQEEYKIGAEKFGWNDRPKTGSQNGIKLKGYGVGAGTWGGGGNKRTEAIVNIYPDGLVDCKIGTQDLGVGTRTIVASLVAEELELELSDVKPLIGESDFPWAPASGGSVTAPSISPTIKLASEAAMKKFKEILAEEYETTADQIEYKKKEFTIPEEGTVAWKTACAALDGKAISEKAQWAEGLSSVGTAGCQFAEVEVDSETGRVQIKRLVAVQDCGLVLNMLTAKSQVNGAVIQEVGYSLFENRLLDADTGIMPNASLENYKIPGPLEIPDIDVNFYDEHERGVIGLGEPPAIPGQGAIANAVANAIGARIYELPITPDKVLMALENRKEG